MNNLELSTALYDHCESLGEIKHYYGLLTIYGLVRTAEQSADPVLTQRCVEILNRFPDQIDGHSGYNFPSYRVGGISRAYALYRGIMTDEKTKAYVDHYAQEMMLATRDDAGIMSHPHRPLPQLVWIDVAMAVTPYLLFAGLALDNQSYIDEAINQSILMYDLLNNSSTNLLHQCKNFVGPGKLSEDYWSRGQGWGIIALTELLQHLPKDHPKYKTVEQYFVRHCKAMLPYQNERGMWRQHLVDPKAWEESSGTGLIAYAYGVGLELGILDEATFEAPFIKAVSGLKEFCINDDMSTEMCCRGCLCPGEGDAKGTPDAYINVVYPVKDDGHSFGPLMLALVQAHRLDKVSS